LLASGSFDGTIKLCAGQNPQQQIRNSRPYFSPDLGSAQGLSAFQPSVRRGSGHTHRIIGTRPTSTLLTGALAADVQAV
jgi:hypothetical protein